MPCSAKYFIIDNEVISTNDFQISELEKGISIYEVVKIIDSTPLFLEEHLTRLYKSAQIKNVNIWFTNDYIIEQIKKLISINDIKKGRLKFALRYHVSGNKLFCFFLENIEPKAEVYKTGVKIITESIERINPNAKVINYKLRKRVRERTVKENAFETLLISNSEKVTECSKSNIFFIKGNTVYTSSAKDVLKGITRDYIFEICNKNNISIIETDIYKEDITNYNAAFITGTSIGVLSVNQIDDYNFSYENGLLKLISENYNELVKKYINYCPS